MSVYSKLKIWICVRSFPAIVFELCFYQETLNTNKFSRIRWNALITIIIKPMNFMAYNWMISMQSQSWLQLKPFFHPQKKHLSTQKLISYNTVIISHNRFNLEIFQSHMDEILYKSLYKSWSSSQISAI